MNKTDQDLIVEAYEQVQEAAPVGIMSRLGNWAARKALKFVPFTGGTKSKLEGKQEFAKETNDLKNNLYKYQGKYNIKGGVTKGILGQFLKINGYRGKTVRELLAAANNPQTKFSSAVPLKDKEINNYLISAVREKGLPEEPQAKQARLAQTRQAAQQTQQVQQQPQVPDIPLQQMDPNVMQAWLGYFKTNPQALFLYTNKFGNAAPASKPKPKAPAKKKTKAKKPANP